MFNQLMYIFEFFLIGSPDKNYTECHNSKRNLMENETKVEYINSKYILSTNSVMTTIEKNLDKLNIKFVTPI